IPARHRHGTPAAAMPGQQELRKVTIEGNRPSRPKCLNPEALSPHRDCNKALVRPALGVDKVLRRVIFEILNYFSVFVKSYANCCVIVH
ncbi:MAG: hypothetical protein ACRDOL_13810, partial [Streptosporangiaceae bacterium]